MNVLRRSWNVFALLTWVLWDLLTASVRISFDIISPPHRMHSAVIALPIDLETDVLITLFANVLSLTPGTLTLDISEDRSHLFIHVMHVPNRDVDAVKARIKQQLERRIRDAFSRRVDS